MLVAATVATNFTFASSQAASIISTVLVEKLKNWLKNSPKEKDRFTKLQELETLCSKIKLIERAGVIGLIVRSQSKINKIKNRLKIISQLTQNQDPINNLSAYRTKLIGLSTKGNKLSPELFCNNVLQCIYAKKNWSQKELNNFNYLSQDIKELKTLNTTDANAKSLQLSSDFLYKYLQLLFDVNFQDKLHNKFKSIENNKEIDQNDIPLLGLLEEIEDIIINILYSNKINSHREINFRLNKLLEENSGFHVLLKLVFAYPNKFPIMQLNAVVILELIALLTNENKTIVLLNTELNTSEIVLSNFFTHYLQKLNTLLNTHEILEDNPNTSEPPSDTSVQLSDTSNQPLNKTELFINENLLEQNIALYVHKLQNHKQHVYNMKEDSNLDVMNVFENQVKPFYTFNNSFHLHKKY